MSDDTTLDGYAAAAAILDTAIQQANNIINTATGATPDVVTAWVCVIGCNDLTTGHASYVLRPGGIGEGPGQAPWITTGLMHEALAKRDSGHANAICDCDDDHD